MTVIGGPPGSGKTRTGISNIDKNQEYFNIDNRCAELNNGSFRKITPEIRNIAAKECERWVLQHIHEGKSFGVESTFRSDVAVRQAMIAQTKGFATHLYFYSLENPELNIERVKARAYSGGHSAPTDNIKKTYTASISNLAKAFFVFDVVRGFDNTHERPREIFMVEKSKLKEMISDPPLWARNALERSCLIEYLSPPLPELTQYVSQRENIEKFIKDMDRREKNFKEFNQESKKTEKTPSLYRDTDGRER